MRPQDEDYSNARCSAERARASCCARGITRARAGIVTKNNKPRTESCGPEPWLDPGWQIEGEAQLFNELVENVPIGLVVLQGEVIDGVWAFRIVSANRAAFEVSHRTEVTAADVLGQTIAALFPSVCERDLAASLLSVIRSGRPELVGEIHYSEGSGIFSIHAFAIANNCVGIALENITQRKQAEYKLRAAQARAQRTDFCERIPIWTKSQKGA